MIILKNEFSQFVSNKKIFPFFIVFFAFFIFSSKDVSALADVNLSIEPAYKGQYKKGEGLPFKVFLENRGGKNINGNLVISGGITEHILSVQLPPYSQKREWIFIHPHYGSNLLFRFTSKDGLNLQKEVSLHPFFKKEGFFVYISLKPGKIQFLKEVFQEKYQLFEVTPQDLWNLWKGYQQADFVLLDPAAIEVMDDFQRRSIKRYLLAGGTLYISGGPYLDAYNHKFFHDLIPYSIDGLVELKPGFLYPNSPRVNILSLNRNSKGYIPLQFNKIPFRSKWKVGSGHVFLLSFDPADEAFYPWIIKQNDLWGNHSNLKNEAEKTNLIEYIPMTNWSKEIYTLFLNVIRWNTAYLLFLIPAGILGIKGNKRILWLAVGLLILISSLASTGALNGKNKLKATTILNIYPGEEQAFLQSKFSILSTRNSKVTTEFKGGYINPYPISRVHGIHNFQISNTGITRNLVANIGMLDSKTFVWERFERLDGVLSIDLAIQPDKIIGTIQNLSNYSLKNPVIWANGKIFPIQTLQGGDIVPVEIYTASSNSISLPKDLDWIKKSLSLNEKKEGYSQNIKILGLWENPVLNLNDKNLLLQEETSVIIYHL